MISPPARIALCLLLAWGVSGCSGGGAGGTGDNSRIDASGTVEFDGKPLPAGSVTFLHHETGNFAVCEISDGSYASESGKGPNPGNNTLTIMGKETAEAYPMWQRPWTRKVVVGETEFTEDYSIELNEVKALDPSTIEVDE